MTETYYIDEFQYKYNQINQRISNENLEIPEVETAMIDLLDEINNYLRKKLAKKKWYNLNWIRIIFI